MNIKQLLFIFFGAAVLASCSKLEEKYRGGVEAVAESGVNVADVLQGAYNALNNPFQDQSRFWAASQHTTDETIGPTRGPDWDDNGVWRVLHSHNWDADHLFLRDTYRELLQAQYAASNVLALSPSAQQAAEAKFIRALSMWCILDGWDQVPVRKDLDKVTVLPEVLKGKAAYDFIMKDLTEALAGLPNGPAIKANKNAARALMMKLYLNKGVYAGSRKTPTFDAADMNQVISLADQIIASGYALDDNYFDAFGPDNSAKSKEMIYALENTNGLRGGNNQSRWYCTLHYNQRPSGWNGFTTVAETYDRFEAADKRRTADYPGVTNVSGLKVGLLFGQQVDQNGTVLKDRKGNNLSYTKTVKLKEIGNDLEITGIRVVKYPPDYVKEFPAENEYVIFRFADVLLMKAEALVRTGKAAEGLTIVNSIRAKRGATAFASLTLDNLLDERSRELYWEGWRRNDLVRFGKFLGAWTEKPASGDERLLFAIPSEQLAVNPNLSQNPGY
ncbi:MAG: RagB/SusD family nutrient uptake outer membrane protein [Bacteroidetes bacterium]|nr:RagB/SusD family nutrient uptake outer membrane protein [Bacteroidota bacterium]